jgi:CheY-like chemotaxis protein
MYKRLLVVDDEKINRRLIVRGLKRSSFFKDFEFIEAENGKEAMEMLEKYNYEIDLIFLDIHMPTMDGVSFLEHRFLNPNIKEIPVLVITTDDNRKKEVFSLGVSHDEFIKKPYSVNDLIEKVAAILASKEKNKIL